MLRIIREHRVPHQEALRTRLAARGFPVAQATLSRDIRDLRLVKVVGADGKPHYTLPEEWENVAPLDSILPTPRRVTGRPTPCGAGASKTVLPARWRR